MSRSHHAETRARQRGIPPLIEEWLDAYGEELYEDSGACVLFFSRKSIRKLERAFGAAPVRKLSEWLDVYKVEDSATSHVITIGHRYKRLRRK